MCRGSCGWPFGPGWFAPTPECRRVSASTPFHDSGTLSVFLKGFSMVFIWFRYDSNLLSEGGARLGRGPGTALRVVVE